MPQELIYTSSPQGLIAGRSGYCTVACSEGMRDALQLKLEQISYYEHIANDGTHPVVCAYRIIDIRGARFHVLSRITDAGSDFTQRTNFLAHHLVFQATEISKLPAPAVIFLEWNGWRNRWNEDPRYLSTTDTGNLAQINSTSYNPAAQWQAITGDAANALGLLEAKPQDYFGVDSLGPLVGLKLIAEASAIIPVHPLKDLGIWGHTFTTCLQERDDSADFKWRLLYSKSPAGERLTTRGVSIKPITSVKSLNPDPLLVLFARSGPQPLNIIRQPASQTTTEGESVILEVVAQGVPPPTKYQWFTCGRDNKKQTLVPNSNTPRLTIPLLQRGANRFLVVIENALGQAVESSVAVISVEAGVRGQTAPDFSSAKPVLAIKPKSGSVAPKAKPAISFADEDTDVNTDDDDPWSEPEPAPIAHWKWIVPTVAFLIVVAILGFKIFGESKSVDNPTPATNFQAVANNDVPTPPTNPPVVEPKTDPIKPPTSAKSEPKSFVFKLPPSSGNLVELTNQYVRTQKTIAERNAAKAIIETHIKDSQAKIKSLQGQLSKIEANSPPGGKKVGAEIDKINQEIQGLSGQIQNDKVQYGQLATDNNSDTTRINAVAAEIKQASDNQKFVAAKNEQLQKNLGKLFTLGDGQSPGFELIGYPQNAPTPYPAPKFERDSLDLKDYLSGSLQFSRDSGKFGFFSVTLIEGKQPPLNTPLVITCKSPDTDESGSLILWPYNSFLTEAATCNESGEIALTAPTGITDKLSHLIAREQEVETVASYMGTNFTFIQKGCPTNFVFEALGDIFKKNKPSISNWLDQKNVAEKFVRFRDELRKMIPRPDVKTALATNSFFDELNKTCLKALGKDIDANASARVYEFEGSALRSDTLALRSDTLRNLDTDLQAKQIKEPEFQVGDFDKIDAFRKANPGVETLDDMLKLLNRLIPTGQLEISRLHVNVQIPSSKNQKPDVLIFFDFKN